uniref:C2H2-type domain-containing protein n=2 Tax=Physcomitrium patens TaxID=3218 RepID=A0A7I4FH50_PHYPA
MQNPQVNGVVMIDKDFPVQEVWQCPFCVKIFAEAKYLDMHKVAKHGPKVAGHTLVELASRVSQAAAHDQKKLLCAELAAMKQVKALEDELRNSIVQIREAEGQIAMLQAQLGQRQEQITRKTVEERADPAQCKQERLDHLETKIENLEKQVINLLQANQRLTSELGKEWVERTRELASGPTSGHAKECQTFQSENDEGIMDICHLQGKVENLTINPPMADVSDRTPICAQALWGKERACAAYPGTQCAPLGHSSPSRRLNSLEEAPASCSGKRRLPRRELRNHTEMGFENWNAVYAQAQAHAHSRPHSCITDCKGEDKIMKSYIQSTQQDDCRCSSTSSCESDDTPPIRRTKIRKQKRKVKRKALQRGRPQGRLAHTSEDSDSTTSSSETPPRQRGNCKKSKSPPRRNTRAYSLTKCPSNSMQESKLLQFSRCRSNGVSLGRAPLPENRVENSEVDPWGSDDDDMLLRCCPRGRVATKLSGY